MENIELDSQVQEQMSNGFIAEGHAAEGQRMDTLTEGLKAEDTGKSAAGLADGGDEIKASIALPFIFSS